MRRWSGDDDSCMQSLSMRPRPIDSLCSSLPPASRPAASGIASFTLDLSDRDRSSCAEPDPSLASAASRIQPCSLAGLSLHACTLRTSRGGGAAPVDDSSPDGGGALAHPLFARSLAASVLSRSLTRFPQSDLSATHFRHHHAHARSRPPHRRRGSVRGAGHRRPRPCRRRPSDLWRHLRPGV